MQLLRDKPPGRFSPACLFRPDSIVVIGAGSPVGVQVTRNLHAGGFKGAVLHTDSAEAIEALPAAADLAIIATPPPPPLLRALAAKGTFAAVVVCAADGLSDAVRHTGVRVLGPGSFGIAVPSIGLNATRAHLAPPVGRIGLVSQSASLCHTVLDWAGPNGVGFSHIVGIGGRADIGFGLVLDWLSRDPGTGAILLDIRQLRDRRAFLSAARAAARLRPLVAIRAGITLGDPGGAVQRAFEAALRRAGALCVTNLEDLLAAAETLARARPVSGETLSIITNTITAGRMAADAVLHVGLHLGSFTHVEPGGLQSLAQAVTAGGGAGVGGVLLVHAPTDAGDQPAVITLAECRDKMKVPLLVCAMGETIGAAYRRDLAAAGLPVFATPEQAVRGFVHLVHHRRSRAAARELPPSRVLAVDPDRSTAREVFAAMRRAARLTSMQDEALAVLCAYGIPVVPNRAVVTLDDAAAAASLLGFPAVVKLRQSVRPDARASGGLALDLHDPAEVIAAARRISHNAQGELPLLVQHQAPRWRELRIRVADDPTFGPVISFGQGGTTADILADVAADLPPLNLALAQALIGRTRAAATLGQFRDNPPANRAAVAEALVRVSQLIVDFPEIAELDLNPLSVDLDGVIAADAWLRLREAGDDGGGLAITPYPAELVQHWTTQDGERLISRPIRPEDAEQHGAFFARLSPQDIRYRFFTAMRELSPEQMARLTQIDYDREMAFVAAHEASGETVGVARLVCESEREGEFAVIVQSDMKGKGVASHLMLRLIDWARRRGLSQIVGQVLADNAPMLAFVRRLGFSVKRRSEEPDVVEARLSLE
jgi:acetyltransferase